MTKPRRETDEERAAAVQQMERAVAIEQAAEAAGEPLGRRRRGPRSVQDHVAEHPDEH